MPLLGGASKLVTSVAGTDPMFSGDPYNLTDLGLPPIEPAVCDIQLRSNGTVWNIRNTLPSQQVGRWDAGLGSLDIADYDFQLEKVLGDIGRGESQNSWIQGFGGMYWGVFETGFGSEEFVGTLRVRPTGGGADFDTASVALTAFGEL